MKSIILENGREIEIDDTPYYIGKDGILYIFMPNGYGYGFEPMGKVRRNANEVSSENLQRYCS